MRRLNAQLALQNLEAVLKFEQSSTKLTKWMVGLTVALVVLTIVIACYTVVLAREESSVGEGQRTATQASPKKVLGPWNASALTARLKKQTIYENHDKPASPTTT